MTQCHHLHDQPQKKEKTHHQHPPFGVSSRLYTPVLSGIVWDFALSDVEG